MKESLLMHHNGDTGEVTIYSAYSDKILFHQTTGITFELSQLIEFAIREAEKAAMEYAKELIYANLEYQIKQWKIS
jgi:hypothetical protein